MTPADPDEAVAAGLELAGQHRFAEAEAYFRQALATRPHDPVAVPQICAILQLREAHVEALALAEDALRADPRQGAVWVARGDALAGLGRPREALEAFRTAVRAGHVTAETLIKLAGALAAEGKSEAALEALEGLLQMQPGLPEARFRRGLLRLHHRDFAAGWDDYEARWQAERFLAESRGFVPLALVPQLATAPTAADLAGQRVLLIGEQGIGDEVMFAGMIPDLARVAASVTCVCESRLVRLFGASFPGLTFVAPQDARIEAEAIDRVVAMGSLGAAFRRDAADFPGAPYLAPSEAVRAAWARRLGPKTRRWRIGLSWRGGAATTRRQARSLSLEQLRPLLDLPGCQFVSLQYGEVADELAAFNAGRGNPIASFPTSDIEDFEELAGLVAGLDLVVSVQTALVHLAGGLGAECLTLVPRTPEWRYMAEGETLPWYGSVRLFRQAQPDTWDDAVGAIAADLVLRPV